MVKIVAQQKYIVIIFWSMICFAIFFIVVLSQADYYNFITISRHQIVDFHISDFIDFRKL